MQCESLVCWNWRGRHSACLTPAAVDCAARLLLGGEEGGARDSVPGEGGAPVSPEARALVCRCVAECFALARRAVTGAAQAFDGFGSHDEALAGALAAALRGCGRAPPLAVCGATGAVVVAREWAPRPAQRPADMKCPVIAEV